VHGVDISHHQGPVDWVQARADGTRFAFLKATEGGDFLDDTFMAHWIATRDAGVKRGAYHFYYWCRNVEDQISWFIRNVPVEADALPPVLDVEWNGDSKTCPKKVPRAEALAAMKRFLRAVEAHYHKKPVIYTSIDFYREIIDGDLNEYPLWVRTVKAHPVVRYANRPWTFWQYDEFGNVDGIKGGVDSNAFVGTEEEWQRFANQQVIVASNTSALPINQQLASAMPPAIGPASAPASNVMTASAEPTQSQAVNAPDANARDELGAMAQAFAQPETPVTQGFAPPAVIASAKSEFASQSVLAFAKFNGPVPLPPVRRKVLAQN
jgi:lysozyme